MRKSVWTAIIVGGLCAGTIDIGSAALINLYSPILILHFIAGGVLGKAALSGGAPATFLGLILQWMMSLIIAAIYVIACQALPPLRRLWILGGLGYGVAIFFVMNYVVVPLSAWARTPHFTVQTFIENMVAMLLFGLIVAFCANRFASKAE